MRPSGAGVLPFFVYDGAVHFLLGREREIVDYAASNQLSAFEGSHAPGESPEQNAAREFVEESMGVLGNDPVALAASLRRGEYNLLVCVNERHWTYVRQYAYSPGVVDRFAAARQALLDVQNDAGTLEAVPPFARGALRKHEVRSEWLEKSQIEIYTLDGLRELLATEGTLRRHFRTVLRQVVRQFSTPSPPGSITHVVE